jgi:peroxiredoxin
METIKKNKQAQDFTLKDQNEKNIRLSNFKGKKVLLSFHPFAWTEVCSKQMQSLEKNNSKFKELNTVALGINVDPIPSKAAWAKKLAIKKTSLLSDFWPHGKVAKQFGVFNKEGGFAERTNIIVDEKGTVIFVREYPISEVPDIEEIIKFLGE